MNSVEPVAGSLWWLPYALIALAGGCFVAALGNAFKALWLRRHRHMKVADPVIAEFLAGVKPPPYALYAAVWFCAGVGCTVALLALPR